MSSAVLSRGSLLPAENRNFRGERRGESKGKVEKRRGFGHLLLASSFRIVPMERTGRKKKSLAEEDGRWIDTMILIVKWKVSYSIFIVYPTIFRVPFPDV